MTSSSWSRDRYPFSAPATEHTWDPICLSPRSARDRGQHKPPTPQGPGSLHTWAGRHGHEVPSGKGRQVRIGRSGVRERAARNLPGATAAESTVCEPGVQAQGDASLSHQTSPSGLETVTQGIKLKAWGCPE